MAASTFAPFFEQVPGIRLRDPLAQWLGAAQGGVIDYSYADAVRLAGHSCPTVASAYWLCVRSLQTLYPDTLPVRGQIEVQLREALDEGTTGVVASVVTLHDLTGVAREVNSVHYLPFEAFITAAVFYLLITVVLVGLFHAAERRWLAPMSRHAQPA